MRIVSRVFVPVLVASATLLSACSSNPGYGNPTGSGLSTATVEGAFNTVPTVTWKAVPAYPSSTTVSTAINGTGAVIPADRAVQARVYVSDAQAVLQQRSLCQAATTAGATAPSCATTFPLTAPATDLVKVLQNVPYQVLSKGSATVSIPAGTTGVFSAFRTGAHLGSRVVGLMQSSTLGGLVSSDSIPAIGIGNHDAVLVVIDFIKLDPPAPKATDVPASQLPALVLKNGKPAGFNFAGIAAPKASDGLKRVILTEGNGDPLTMASTVTFNYLGMVYKGSKPFDQNYTTNKPLTYPLAKLVQGWGLGLTGVKVGSRVLLQIPPALGYGAQSQPGIPGNSTLYFVLDIISAS